VALQVDALAVRPHLQPAGVVEASHRARRRHGCVGDRRLGEAGMVPLVGAGGRGWVGRVVDALLDRRLRLQPGVQVRVVGEVVARLPGRELERARPCLDGLFLALRHHADEAAVAQHRHHARHRADGREVQRGEHVAAIGRAHHAPVEHAGQHHVVHERRPARHLGRQVEARHVVADDARALHRLQRRAVPDVGVEQGGMGQRPVVQPGRRAVAQDGAVGDRQRGGVGIEPARGGIDQQGTGKGAGLPQGRAAFVDGAAAGGDALVGRAAVLAGCMRMRCGASPSSSAAICARAVTMPWPISTLPVRTSATPSRSRTHDDRRGLSCSAAGQPGPGGRGEVAGCATGLAAVLIAAPPRRRPAGRRRDRWRAGCARGCRNGTGCGPAPGRCRPAWAAAAASAGPRRP
jgi:hypothetical protein